MNTNFKQSSAYELADELLRDNTQLTVKAANMLRQQADRIAELEKEVEECWCGGHSYAYLRAKNRLPQTNPENIWTSCSDCGQKVTEDLIHTCSPQTKQTPDGLIDPKSYYIGYADGKKAPQTKPLSDEEIDEILDSLDVYIDTHAGVKLFARAIEERHGIK